MRPVQMLLRTLLRVCSWPLRALWEALHPGELFGSRAAAERQRQRQTQAARPRNPTEVSEQRTYGIRETIR